MRIISPFSSDILLFAKIYQPHLTHQSSKNLYWSLHRFLPLSQWQVNYFLPNKQFFMKGRSWSNNFLLSLIIYIRLIKTSASFYSTRTHNFCNVVYCSTNWAMKPLRYVLLFEVCVITETRKKWSSHLLSHFRSELPLTFVSIMVKQYDIQA